MKAKELVNNILAYYKSGKQAGFDPFDNRPVYAIENGGRCVVGCQLTRPFQVQKFADEHAAYEVWRIYDKAKELNRKDIYNQIKRILPDDLSEEDALKFLTSMQNIHDEIYELPHANFVKMLENELSIVLRHYTEEELHEG